MSDRTAKPSPSAAPAVKAHRRNRDRAQPSTSQLVIFLTGVAAAVALTLLIVS